jgi:hypothetical protein
MELVAQEMIFLDGYEDAEEPKEDEEQELPFDKEFEEFL